MSDNTNPDPQKEDGKNKPNCSGEIVFVNPIQSKTQEGPPNKKGDSATPDIKPLHNSASFRQLFICRFRLWREKRKLSIRSREKAKWTDVGTLILTAVVAGAALLSAWIFYRQLGAMQSQLGITDRPWIKGEPHVTSPIMFGDDGTLSISVTFVLDNVGHSVATDATVYASAFIPKWGGTEIFTEPLKRQGELCGKVQPHALTVTLFPGDITPFTVGLSISKQEIEAGIVPSPPGMTNPPSPPGKRTQPILFGCVDYQFSDLPGHHQTGFIYNVVRTDPKTPNVPYLIIVGDTLPVANVGLERWGFGGDYAN